MKGLVIGRNEGDIHVFERIMKHCTDLPSFMTRFKTNLPPPAPTTLLSRTWDFEGVKFIAHSHGFESDYVYSAECNLREEECFNQEYQIYLAQYNTERKAKIISEYMQKTGQALNNVEFILADEECIPKHNTGLFGIYVAAKYGCRPIYTTGLDFCDIRHPNTSSSQDTFQKIWGKCLKEYKKTGEDNTFDEIYDLIEDYREWMVAANGGYYNQDKYSLTPNWGGTKDQFENGGYFSQWDVYSLEDWLKYVEDKFNTIIYKGSDLSLLPVPTKRIPS